MVKTESPATAMSGSPGSTNTDNFGTPPKEGSDSQSQVDESTPSDSETTKQKPRRRKKKVEIACVYCRRSHMICDESRPCQRCIKRGIGHLCYDEPSNMRQRKKAATLRKTKSEGSSVPLQAVPPAPTMSIQSDIRNQNIPVQETQPQQLPLPHYRPQPKSLQKSVLSQTLPYNQEPFFYSEHAGSEFSSLNDFLSMIDDPELVHGALTDDPNAMLNFGVDQVQPQQQFPPGDGKTNSTTNLSSIFAMSPNANLFPATFGQPEILQQQSQPQPQQPQQLPAQQRQQTQPTQPSQPTQQPQQQSQQQSQQNFNQESHQPVISDSARDKFFLTAADPTTEISPEERLKQVIKAKLEAGLLQPYNYAKGYARLQSYMDNYMNITSRQRILKPLSIFRPAFRAIARTLKDVDLVLVEESFERMLLDYDRVFTSMAIPACLWRRTGEIYRGNKEFASLVGVTVDDLKDGKLAIYELMSEESAVNFWEKYGAIAFDKGQKAVLTSCNLRTKDGIKRKSCCFSFTIRRDRYNIPSCIVGNFIPIDPN
ncbi:uncharacterized protein SPAPADRAFT_59559 [Spathaspora passalidarum NRRL Y-27907]|uniref:Zn(2)-C6 fungal-type domain-containing protein n=1 Tax=Spathaspora passalidarum (strain NRRL Y-27907 / 11-Y1) TaxID=619300 RepID=G3AHI0_SPAPN|nr:uncharacterized protein SPAPADRAFT_59559 [Spathaspora passalidarum NRRL Y-27907]EGW34144.1 hypothetical protein SPAPADRAFT_59559 [Spathaspora passalidarum NRRL Y-27907]